MDELTFKVGGEAIPLRLTLKSIVRWEDERRVAVIAPGVEFTTSLEQWIAAGEPGWIHRLAQFVYCGTMHAKRFKTFDDFMDAMTDEELSAAVQTFAELGSKQLQAADTEEGGGDSAPNPTAPEVTSG